MSRQKLTKRFRSWSTLGFVCLIAFAKLENVFLQSCFLRLIFMDFTSLTNDNEIGSFYITRSIDIKNSKN